MAIYINGLSSDKDICKCDIMDKNQLECNLNMLLKE